MNENIVENYPKYTWYSKKEIPNIVLTLSNKLSDINDNTQEIYFDNLINYYEEYNTTTGGWKVVLVVALMSPTIYELLTKKYRCYYTQTYNFWRNATTGKDESFIEPQHRFTNMSIKHKLTAEGDATRWYITLWNDKLEISKPKEIKIENVEL